MSYSDLIGAPFRYGGRGPDVFDCYGLVRFLYFQRTGVWPVDHISPEDGCGAKITAMMVGDLYLWEECQLEAGAVLLFKVPGNLHVGTYMGDGRFIHTWEKSGGVTIERLEDWEKRLMGVYEYVGD